MTQPIVVVGHRNPDNDAICAAISYAFLKNELARRQGTGEVYVPARLGALPKETACILDRYHVPEPELITHVHTRIADVMTRNPLSISSHATLLEAGRMLRKHNVRALVVTNDDGLYSGLISTRMIAERYIASTDQLQDTPESTMAVAADLIASLGQRVSDILEKDVLILQEEELLKDTIDTFMASALREAVVLDDNGRCIGIVTRSDIAKPARRKVILVDHNERRQAPAGIDEAEIVGIVDHHRIADISTSAPIPFINLPLGSTATIVSLEFERYGIPIPEDMAAIMLSALMTDTVVLKSPTTTTIDRAQADKLAAILGVQAKEFGLSVFKCRGNDEEMSAHDMITADSKEFAIEDGTALISQHETVDLPAILAREQEIRKEMQSLVENHGYSFVLFAATDIIAEGSQVFAEGDTHVPSRVFGPACAQPGGLWLPGVLSRKKQLVPRLLGE